MATQHFFVHNQYLGSCETSLTLIHGQAFRRGAYAWFCPECGDIWARAPIAGQTFTVVYERCVKHPFSDMTSATGFPTTTPGSLLKAYIPGLLEDLPELALKREFLLHLDYYESNL